MFCHIVTNKKKGFDTSSMLNDGKGENSPLKWSSSYEFYVSTRGNNFFLFSGNWKSEWSTITTQWKKRKHCFLLSDNWKSEWSTITTQWKKEGILFIIFWQLKERMKHNYNTIKKLITPALLKIIFTYNEYTAFYF